MFIKSLVIDGFKSYHQRTEINGFDPRFNAITGLNGSGKSNILDAICFLLGITNLSHVRAANLNELVYKCGQAGIRKATVTAVFDNSDKSQSPCGYEQFDELTITRQIIVGGRSKCLINGTNATATRVHDLFHSVQLNVNNPHFLIMQGRITKILNMKPPEILSLLEEAASTKLYENKKLAALQTIERKDVKLREIDRILAEDINPTIQKLREERSSYLEYQNAVREIDHLEKFLIAYEYTCLEAVKSGLSSEENGVAASLAEQARAAYGEQSSAETEVVQLQMRRKHLQNELAKQEAAVIKAFGHVSISGESKEEVRHKELIAQVEELTRLLARAEADDKAFGSEHELTERQIILDKKAKDLRHVASTMATEISQLLFEPTDPEPNFDKRRVHGPVAKLFRVKEFKHIIALEIIAGNKLQNIVVDTEHTGKSLLARGQLRQRITILPLNKIHGNPVPDATVQRAQLLVGADNVVTALSLIEFDDIFKPVMEYVFGGALICPNMAIAKRVAFHPGIEKKTVTLEGDVFDPQGTLCGGSRASFSDGLLSRIFKWHNAEVGAQEAELEVAQGEANVKVAEARSEKISQMHQSLESYRNQLSQLENQMKQGDRPRLLADVAATKEELKQVEKLLSKAEESLSQIRARATLAHEKVANADNSHGEEEKDAEKAFAEARNQVEATIAALREKDSLKETLRLEAEEVAKELNGIKVSLEEAKEAVKTAELKEEFCIEAERSAKEELAKACEAVKQHRELIHKTLGALKSAETEASQLVDALNQTNSLIDKLSHQIEIQMKEGDQADGRMEQLLEAHPWINSEKQNFGRKNGVYCFVSRNPTETRQRVEFLKGRLNLLCQTVNMRAMTMLDSAEKQYSELMERREIVLGDKQKIQSVIDDLDKRKEQVLMSAYNTVNEEFNNIFGTLLPRSRARLSPPEKLTVLDGLEIKVAFGDVWKDSLAELSGGQRSLAALSLILALLRFKPAPLYILDEVDAALDLSHTQNIGQLIKNHFQHSQFIVVSLKDGMFNNANVLFKTKFTDGISVVTRHVPLQVIHDNRQSPERSRKRVR
ncbi:unnamed protein product [Heterobilharzia americana]|nr:unnamed protein product [Heterobilharzia americana]